MFHWPKQREKCVNNSAFASHPECNSGRIHSTANVPFPGSVVRIRQYEEKDRDAVRRICCDTGFQGEKIDVVFRDRELFADIATGPYLDYEPEWAFVAENADKVVGYMLASVSSRFVLNRTRTGIAALAGVALRLYSGRYSAHPRSEKFARWLLYRACVEEPRHPPGAGHMHFSIEKAFRGTGVGMQMWKVFERDFAAAGKNHYYGQFLSWRGRNIERVYSRFGFRTYSRKKTSIFEEEIPDLEMICMHKWLP